MNDTNFDLLFQLRIDPEATVSSKITRWMVEVLIKERDTENRYYLGENYDGIG